MIPESVLFEAAYQCYLDQDLDNARSLCLRACLAYPDSGPLWQLAGLVDWFLGDTAACVDALERAALLIPLQPLAQLCLASAYALQGKRELARFVYDHLIELPEFPIPLLPELARGLGSLGEDAAALAVCERLVELRPSYHPAWFGVAFYRLRLGHAVEDALQYLEQAHHLAPQARTYRLNLAVCLARLHRYAEAFCCIDDIAISEIPHAAWIRQIRPIFVALGDLARVWACDERLRALNSPAGPNPGWDRLCPRCFPDG